MTRSIEPAAALPEQWLLRPLQADHTPPDTSHEYASDVAPRIVINCSYKAMTGSEAAADLGDEIPSASRSWPKAT
jgi:hypothetical protein